MAAERLSKLQRWVLAKAFQKTMQRDSGGLPALGFSGEAYWHSLYRPEILGAFFANASKPQAQATLTRSLKNLQRKGLIAVATGPEGRQGITLTEAGIETALQVLTEGGP